MLQLMLAIKQDIKNRNWRRKREERPEGPNRNLLGQGKRMEGEKKDGGGMEVDH